MIRKIIKIGNSEGVTIPVRYMRVRKLSIGQKVEVLIGKPGSEIRYLELMQELAEFEKKYEKTLKNLASK